MSDFNYNTEILSEKEFDLCSNLLIILAFFLFLITLPFSLILSLKKVYEYEKAVILRLGRVLSTGGPGLFFVLPCIDTYIICDLRTVTFDVAPQEILTRDSVSITVDAVCYFRTVDPISVVTNVSDAKFSTRSLAATTLRNILGTKTLHEVLQDKEIIAHHMQTLLDSATESWGIKVERVELKDVILPASLQRAMAVEAEAARDAKAKVIAAIGEKKASFSLKQAADVIKSSPVAIQLRYLQTLSSISTEKNKTIIFPVPIELIKSLMK